MKNINKKIVIIICVIILIVRGVDRIYVYNFKYSEWKNKKIEVIILDINKVDEEKNVYKVKYNKDIFLLDIKEVNKKYKIGDKLTILSSNYEIKKYNNPYEFNYKLYLSSNGIISRIYCSKVLKEEKCTSVIFNSINYIRSSISNKLDRKIDVIKSNLIKSFMYGDKTLIDENIKQEFINIGLGHVLCISGTHLSYLINTFQKVTKNKRKQILNIMIIVYFYIISLFNISLLRPICMYIFSIYNPKMNFNKRFFIALWIILILNPFYIFNIGIIFSFLSILSIKIFNNTIKSWFEVKLKIQRKVIKYIIQNISLTLSAQILIIPFQLYYFQKFTLISVFSNVIISFTLNILMYSIFSLFILFFIPIISDFLIAVCNKVICIVIFQVEILDKINFFNINIPRPNIIFFICFYLVIIICLYQKLVIVYFWKSRKRVRKYIKCIKNICVLYMIIWYIYTMYFESYIIFFNVGQGNMALLHRYTKNIVIDIGSTKENFAGNVLINFFKAKNINKIDMILLTHMHSDHINGIKTIVDNNIKIKSVCYSMPYKEVEEYNKLKQLLKENNVGKIIVEEGDKIRLNDINIDILTPPKTYYINDNDMLNANSTVYLLSLNKKNYLFLGDSTKKTEQYILNTYMYTNKNSDVKEKLKNIYVFQVAHHGSTTSSSEEFISKINSRNAIFSAQKSVYGHPNEKIIDLFKKYNYKIYLTEKNGAIRF